MYSLTSLQNLHSQQYVPYLYLGHITSDIMETGSEPNLHVPTHIPFVPDPVDLNASEATLDDSSASSSPIPTPPVETVPSSSSNPPPAPDASTSRPLNPMVGMLGRGIGGLGIGGAKPFLKSTKRATTFVLKSGAKLQGKHTDWSVTPTERMRNIDELRKHIPTPEECDLLNVPDDRLFVDNIKDVLYLSGGCAGVRFSTSELRSLQALVANISDLCKILEKTYHKLSPEQTKLNINTFLTDLQGNTVNTLPGGDYNKITYFHGVADNLLGLIHQLQGIVHEKQQTIDKSAAKMKFDSDPDGGAAMPRPKWLEVLMKKFDAYLNSNSTSNNVLLSKGKLAAFISFCLFDEVLCTEEERESIEDLLEASNDATVQFFIGDNLSQTISRHPRVYWAKRFFDFLKKIHEMKSVPADESAALTWHLN